MEKTIEIDGKQVKLKSHAAIPLMYQAQFKRDFFADILKMNKLSEFNTKKKNFEVLADLDSTVFYNILWIYAKSANPNIEEPIKWFSQFEEFPLQDIILEITDLLQHSFKTKKK